ADQVPDVFDDDQVEAAQVQAMEDAYAKAEIAKDVDGVMVYYADDVDSYMSDRAPVSTKEALKARMAERLAKDSTHTTPTFKVKELFVGGDYMTEIGSWSDADSTGAEVDHGHYLSIFRKKGDGWECIREMAVSSMPKEKEEMAAEKKKPEM
ncbi:MAG: nuclear transport factor 2 family protein, partial [Flavobacteriales bacterium]|nr:nuclear transport factor 2 family protein [Flavobacteriales bacterium]